MKKKKKAPTPAAFQSNSKTHLYETFLKKNSHINQKIVILNEIIIQQG